MTTAVGASQQLDEVGDRRGTGTEFANEIFAVVDVLNRESGLRRAVSDTGSETKARQGLIDAVFTSKSNPRALKLKDSVSAFVAACVSVK